MCIEQGKCYIYQIFIKFKCELYHITHMCLGLTDELCQFEKSLREIWYGTSRNDMSAVSLSQASTSLGCTSKIVLFSKIPVETWCNWGRKVKAWRRKGKKGDKSAMILAGSGIAVGGRGCNIFWFLVQQNNPTKPIKKNINTISVILCWLRENIKMFTIFYV